jgi:hypothetical protein
VPSTHLPHLTPSATAKSTNWSGYGVTAASGKHIRFVSANFNVPDVNCTSSPVGSSGFAYAAHWVGLDGLNDKTVEQTGASGFCDSSGTPTYIVWYEMFPSPPASFTGVNPGDAMKASVFFDGSKYNLVLDDVTNGTSLNVTLGCPSGSACKNNSAEIITEDPGGAVAGGVNLADFGMINYTGATVTSTTGKHGTLASKSKYWKSTSITMVDPSGSKMAVPSALYGGQAFSVSWRSFS